MKTITVCPFFVMPLLFSIMILRSSHIIAFIKNVSLNIDKSTPLYGCNMLFFFNPLIYRQSFGLFPVWGLLRIKLLPSCEPKSLLDIHLRFYQISRSGNDIVVL